MAFADNIFLRIDELGKQRVGPLIEIAFKAPPSVLKLRDQPPEPTCVGDIAASLQRQSAFAHGWSLHGEKDAHHGEHVGVGLVLD